MANENIKLYNDDCLKVLSQIPSESIDLVATDCPYHIVSGGCSSDIGKDGLIHQSFGGGGILSKLNPHLPEKKDSHRNKYNSDTKHISLCGILNDYDPTTYTKQGKLFKFNEIKFSEWLPEAYRVLKQNTHCYIMINARNLKELQ